MKARKFSFVLILFTLVLNSIGGWKVFSEKAEKDRLETELLALDKKSGELREAIDEAQEKSKENITFLSTRIDTRKKEASEKETLLKSLNDQLEAKTAALGANTERKDELSSEIQETKKRSPRWKRNRALSKSSPYFCPLSAWLGRKDFAS